MAKKSRNARHCRSTGRLPRVAEIAKPCIGEEYTRNRECWRPVGAPEFMAKSSGGAKAHLQKIIGAKEE